MALGGSPPGVVASRSWKNDDAARSGFLGRWKARCSWPTRMRTTSGVGLGRGRVSLSLLKSTGPSLRSAYAAGAGDASRWMEISRGVMTLPVARTAITVVDRSAIELQARVMLSLEDATHVQNERVPETPRDGVSRLSSRMHATNNQTNERARASSAGQHTSSTSEDGMVRTPLIEHREEEQTAFFSLQTLLPRGAPSLPPYVTDASREVHPPTVCVTIRSIPCQFPTQT